MKTVILDAITNVQKKKPQTIQIPFKDVQKYLEKSDLHVETFKDYMLVRSANKVVTIKQEGDYRIGQCIFSTK